jgi:hypothetical protein
MKTSDSESQPAEMSTTYRLLERAAACVLVLVVAALGWIIVAASIPEWGRLASLEVEVIFIISLLLAALLLVSVVALLHTRK